jgi:hypothetical protein
MIKALALAAGIAASFGAPSLLAQDAEDMPDAPAQDAAEEPETLDPDMVEELNAEPGLEIMEAGERELSDFLWLARPLVVFADGPNDPRFVQQMGYIEARPEELLERDVVVIVDTDPSAESPIRTALRPRGFDLVLIGKDGQRYLRKPNPWDVREITRSIDKMPMRQQEMRDQRGL